MTPIDALCCSRDLDNGDEIYVVMFNSGKGSCAAEGNSTMTVTWAELELPLECMVSTTELITGRYAMEEGQVSAELRVGASAAFRMHHHC